MPSQRDIVLVPVPFTDLSSSRRRPVIVVSNDQYNRTTDDIVVVAMTSNPLATKYSFNITSADLEAGTLNHPDECAWISFTPSRSALWSIRSAA